jgi:fructose-1,6-bisphosphatase/sedoheptulose 1,7-bisphosphatase-like protein
VLAGFALADVIRPESREAVAAFKEQGVRVAMLTGDSEDVARWVAGELGIDEYFAQVLPEHKNARIQELQRSGAQVAMVGDGVNDAPALAVKQRGVDAPPSRRRGRTPAVSVAACACRRLVSSQLRAPSRSARCAPGRRQRRGRLAQNRRRHHTSGDSSIPLS